MVHGLLPSSNGHHSHHHDHHQYSQIVASTTLSPALTSPLFRQNYGPHHHHHHDNDDDDDDDNIQDMDEEDHATMTTKAVSSIRDLLDDPPSGFIKALIRSSSASSASSSTRIIKRYWIIDDSLSMTKRDGHISMSGTGMMTTTMQEQQQQQETAAMKTDQDKDEHHWNNHSSSSDSSTWNHHHHYHDHLPFFALPFSSISTTTRWNELQDTCFQQAALASHWRIPTQFNFLHSTSFQFRIPRYYPTAVAAAVAVHPKQQQQQQPLQRQENEIKGGQVPENKRRPYHDDHSAKYPQHKSSSSFYQHRRRGRRDDDHDDLERARKILYSRVQPKGTCTPLTARVRAIHQEIMAQDIRTTTTSKHGNRNHNERIAIVLATDGLPTSKGGTGLSTDQDKLEFQAALAALPSDRTTITIRLCTDDVDVVNYYHNVVAASSSSSSSSSQKHLYPHVTVLDDYAAEAARIHQYNPWLNYGLALHRIREMGGVHCEDDGDDVNTNLIQQLSRRPLTAHEVARFCQFLFDWSPPQESFSVPSHTTTTTTATVASLAWWQSLQQAVERSNAEQKPIWNPVTQKVEPWICLDRFRHKDSLYTDDASLLWSEKEREQLSNPLLLLAP